MNLNSGSDDESVKLVRYRIFYTKADSERLLLEAEEIVDYPFDLATFATWKIAAVLHNHALDAKLNLSSENRKYLKVACEAIGSFPRETLQDEQRQIERLAALNRKL